MITVKEQVLLAPYTMYKIGGSARFFIEVKNADECVEALRFAAEQNLPFFILGAGSNTLVADRGFDGVVIHSSSGEVRINGDRLSADAGVMMARAVLESAKASLTGFEWGIGIPGTVGGSVRGNAGCFGGEMGDIVESIDIFDSQKATSYKLQATSCEFGYRDSVFKKHPEFVILSATLHLKNGDAKEIQEGIKKIMFERASKQDIGTKCCGCIFKNIPWNREDIAKEKLLVRFPELNRFIQDPNIPASYLVDAAGLKGTKIGKAAISSKHANYFLNEGDASAEEVVMLIALAKDRVRRKFGIQLEEEIQYVGF